ncbi:MAG: WbqC family protein [Prevotella sp.]|nr:WbqC family protein [Prevotella sp.]
MRSCLLSSTYFGPVQWYQKLNRYDVCLIEQHDSFIKQTFRNRCVIATTNGTQTLSIPIEHASQDQPLHSAQKMRDIGISDHGNWRHLHWYALQSAYGESPFFDYYIDDLRPFFEQKWEYLLDFNMAITEKMCKLLDIRPNIRLTAAYGKPISDDSCEDGLRRRDDDSCMAPQLSDFREAIRPKHPIPDDEFNPTPYYQVYQQKHGFLPNLSILDLLFNEGNESILYL